MWVLDPGNSSELLDRLRPHALSPDFEVVWCGEGWRALVSECHHELAASFPDYRFYAIKQKWGALAYQVRPRTVGASAEELAMVHAITERYAQRSRRICEWCGRPGSLLSDGPERMTLCSLCSEGLKSTKYPHQRPVP
ncbi:conserved hypothetical protein [Aeromicrobium sp. 9AM]|nr:conserved hypothetical protein [Aeromicrobium sp. 9AM]